MASGGLPDLGDLPSLSLDGSWDVTDAAFEIAPAKQAEPKQMRKTTTIFVRVKNESQFQKAKAVITAAMLKAKIDHNI